MLAIVNKILLSFPIYFHPYNDEEVIETPKL
jgi:hypothetical protein